MQTFVPLPDFAASARVLDDRRLGKQRVETYQILRALTFPSQRGWRNHPAVRMWRGFVPALVAYGVAVADEWTARGYADTTAASMLAWTDGRRPELAGLIRDGRLPAWWGHEPLHRSHQSALVRKDPDYYRAWFPDVADDLPYLWPSAAFPRWPVRVHHEQALPVEAAALELGIECPHEWQTNAVETLLDGADVLLGVPHGQGASTTGLLAGLATAGTTVWVSEHAGRPADLAPVRVADVLARPPRTAPREAPAEEDQTGRDATGSDAAEELAAADPATQRPLTARPPTEADLEAMRLEALAASHEPAFRFLRPGQLGHSAGGRAGLIVVDDAETLDEGQLRQVAVAQPALGAPPVLAVTRGLDRERRASLSLALGLRSPRVVGGGFGRPRVCLVVVPSATPAQARSRLEAEIRQRPGGAPAVVVTHDRAAAERIAALLTRRALPSLAVATGMRASRVTAAGVAWRSRRLAALVAPFGTDVTALLGRREVSLLVHADAPAGQQRWRTELAVAGRAGGQARAVSLGDVPGVTPGGCRWAALLDHVGEVIELPCGRCDVCAPRLLAAGALA